MSLCPGFDRACDCAMVLPSNRARTLVAARQMRPPYKECAMRSTARSLRLAIGLSLSALLLTACFVDASRPAAAFGFGGFGRGGGGGFGRPMMGGGMRGRTMMAPRRATGRV